MPNSSAQRFDLPVTLVTGYLGSGKTTFINQRLLNSDGVRYAILVNDFGELGIDAELIAASTDNTISLVNGCVCCSLADDMDTAMAQIQRLSYKIDWVLFEASGVADPERIRIRIRARPGFILKEFITLVDVTRIKTLVNDKFVGQHIQRQLQLGLGASNPPMAGADVNCRMLLTKTDLLGADVISNIRMWLDNFLGDARLCNRSAEDGFALPQFYSQIIEHSAPITRAKFGDWLNQLKPGLTRIKGFVYLTENHDIPYLLQWVSGVWTLEIFGQSPAILSTHLILISTEPLDVVDLNCAINDISADHLMVDSNLMANSNNREQ